MNRRGESDWMSIGLYGLGKREELVSGDFGEVEAAEPEFLGPVVAVQLESQGAGLEHFRLVGEVEDEGAIGHHADAVADDEQLDPVPFPLLFGGVVVHGAIESGRDNAVAAVGIPDSPVVAEHEQRSLETVLVVSLIDETFPERRHGGVHGGVFGRQGLLDLEEEPELAVAFPGEEVGGAGHVSGVGTDDLAVLGGPVSGIAIPALKRGAVEELGERLAFGDLRNQVGHGLTGGAGEGEGQQEQKGFCHP